MRIAIVIPTYNEKDNLKELLPAIFSILPHAAIVVVDDNSPDKTAREVSKLKKKYSNLHLVERKQKGGRGSAVIEGFKYAYKHIKAQIYIEMDADFSHDPKELPQLINLSQSKAIILASRYIKGSKIINWPISRRITSILANKIIRLILKLPMRDNTNGYRCYQKEAVNLLINYRFKTRGYILLSESAHLLYQNGFSFIEIPTVFKNRRLGRSNTTIFEFFKSIIDLVRIRR